MNWSRERYRILFEMVKDAIFISNFEGKIIDVNPSWLELFGYRSKKEVLKLDLARDIYVNPEDRKRLFELLEKGRFVKDYEIEAKRRDGAKIIVSISDQVIQDERGRIVGYVGMIRDVTETREYERRTEEALRKSEEQLRTLVTSAPMGLSIIGRDGTYEYVNPKFVEMFGYTPEDVPTGKKWFERAYPDSEYRRKVIASWIEDLQEESAGETRPRVFTVTCKDGSEKEVFFRPVSLTDGRQLVTYEDITERQRAEEALQREKRAVELVAKIGRIISSTLEIDKVYELFAEEVGKAIPFDRIAINIPYPEKGIISTAYIAGHDVPGRRPGDVVPLAGSLTEEAMRKRAGFLIQTEDVGGVLGRLPGLSPTIKAGFRSLMAVPLISKDRVIGVLHLRSFKPNAYTEEDVNLAESIGNQIAGAIANSELYAERIRADEELKESEERYRSLVEDINDGYFIVQDGRFVYVNQAFANLTGNSKEVILGSESQKFFPQKYLERLAKDDLKRKGDRKQNEFEISRKDGENLVLEIRSRIIEYNGRPAIAGICKDITEGKKAEMALNEKVEELERWYQLTVDREVKMTQLKSRIEELESELRGRQRNQTR
jgi:PAS domain S-box-containing protein